MEPELVKGLLKARPFKIVAHNLAASSAHLRVKGTHVGCLFLADDTTKGCGCRRDYNHYFFLLIFSFFNFFFFFLFLPRLRTTRTDLCLAYIHGANIYIKQSCTFWPR